MTAEKKTTTPDHIHRRNDRNDRKSETHALQPFDFSHLIDNVPKIKMLDYHIDNIQFTPIDSSDMNPSGWAEISNAIASHYDEYDGFVVLHGTDTMAYTASALSFMLGNLHKPVIITGSQLPIGEVRTDGEENLITALQIAAATTFDGSPMVQEVAILFENYLWRGNRSTKMSADNFNAFKSNNYPQLAKIGLGIHFSEEALWRPKAKTPLQLNTRMDSNVMFIELYPGMTQQTLRYLLNAPRSKGHCTAHIRSRQRSDSRMVYRGNSSGSATGSSDCQCHSVRERRCAPQALRGRRQAGQRRCDFRP